jgi:hypothetical protein
MGRYLFAGAFVLIPSRTPVHKGFLVKNQTTFISPVMYTSKLSGSYRVAVMLVMYSVVSARCRVVQAENNTFWSRGPHPPGEFSKTARFETSTILTRRVGVSLSQATESRVG